MAPRCEKDPHRRAANRFSDLLGTATGQLAHEKALRCIDVGEKSTLMTVLNSQGLYWRASDADPSDALLCGLAEAWR